MRANFLEEKTLRGALQRAACPASPSVLKSFWLQAMSLKHFLFLLTGDGLFSGLFHRYPEYQCAKKGGTCNFSPCPLFTRVDGACYSGKAKCCV